MDDPPALTHTTNVLRRMTARSRYEVHRASTPLELFFDLCFVVAVAQAGAQLVPALAEGHVAAGIVSYLAVFFGVWWAWMNFTWFASAYDTDDVAYRVFTLIQMAGVQVFAAGVPRAFVHHDWRIAVWGYVVMRLAQSTQWFRAAASERGPARRTAARYGVGLLICQAGWVAMLYVPREYQNWVFLALVIVELAVPVVAERTARTSWHPHHIAERYGLFTLIVLGETVAAGTIAVQSGMAEHGTFDLLIPIAAGGLLLVFSAWWIYFSVPAGEYLESNRVAIPWGYGHFLIFISAAAIGAGLEVAVEQATGHNHLSATAAAATVTVPAGMFLVASWLLHSWRSKTTVAQHLVLPLMAVGVLVCTFAGRYAVPAAGLVAALGVTVGILLSTRVDRAPAD
ncbi:MAG TPA: low temperature requirement protein A [Stackebrandtia sp.]|jgi:low temperature requirement protein LtrA|uniref:low temperature requirement protein A n=1 Tax=Stackebrandtia sp. TaxID=2023065 RepID=UPI002D2ED393|nr:low temperature requirement protein A [Stackebrandtia sp.]HZE37428.1 low temperature requirement protein A [Stackebrandtia sp.]